MNNPDEPPERPERSLGDIIFDASIELLSQTVHGVPEDQLTRLLAVYHEEWERRNGERWVLA